MEYQLKNKLLTVTISEEGAELQSVLAADGTEYLWQGDMAYWKKRAPHLFPVCGRLTNGRTTMDSEECRMDTHGFFRWKQTVLTERTADRLTFTLLADEDTLAQYPRRFRAAVSYTLWGETLGIEFAVTNEDTRRMWFAYGRHPGFCVPRAKGLAFSDYRVRFCPDAAPLAVGMSEMCFVQGGDTPLALDRENSLPLCHGLFDRDTIYLRNAGHEVTLESPKDTRAVTLRFPQMDYLGLWHTPKTEAPFLCIEPWTALPDRQGKAEELSEKPDMLYLSPQETYRNAWEIAFINCGENVV